MISGEKAGSEGDRVLWRRKDAGTVAMEGGGAALTFTEWLWKSVTTITFFVVHSLKWE